MKMFGVFEADFYKLGKGKDTYWGVDLRPVDSVRARDEEQAIEVAKKKGYSAPIVEEVRDSK